MAKKDGKKGEFIGKAQPVGYSQESASQEGKKKGEPGANGNGAKK